MIYELGVASVSSGHNLGVMCALVVVVVVMWAEDKMEEVGVEVVVVCLEVVEKVGEVEVEEVV